MSRRRFMGLAVALVALNAFFWLAQSGFALPRGFLADLFGKQMIRAEVVRQTATGTPEDIQIDRGVITSASAASFTIQEADGRVVTFPLASTTRIVGGGARLRLVGLRPRLLVLVIRHANGPAETVQIEGRGGR